MGNIKWETLITENDGRVSLHRLRKFLVLVWFCIGMGVVITATLIEVLTKFDVPTGMIMILAGAAIVPVTGGQLSDAYFQTRIGSKIEAGQAPGRRRSDAIPTLTDQPPIGGDG